jgi:hypothetical protein
MADGELFFFTRMIPNCDPHFCQLVLQMSWHREFFLHGLSFVISLLLRTYYPVKLRHTERRR